MSFSSQCFFQYDQRWPELRPYVERITRSGGGNRSSLDVILEALEQRDRDLEDHLNNRPCGGGGSTPAIPGFMAWRTSQAYSTLTDGGVGKWLSFSDLYGPSTGVSRADSNRSIAVAGTGWWHVDLTMVVNSINGGFDSIQVRGLESTRPGGGATGVVGFRPIDGTGPGRPNGDQFDWSYHASFLAYTHTNPAYLCASVVIDNAVSSFPELTYFVEAHWVAELSAIDEL